MRRHWVKYDTLSSTNSQVSDLLKQGPLEEGTIVVADYQDAGRGQGIHSWVSEGGRNLLMSVLLYPAFLSASRQFLLSEAVSLALIDALGTLGVEASIKWPNDVLASRGKIAGILIEHGIMAGKISNTIAGIGLNLNQTEFPVFPQPASSFRLETGKPAGIRQAGELVEDRLLSRYDDLRAGRTGKVEQDYLEHLFLTGVPSLFRSGEGLFEGIIRGVNEYGELRVERDGRIQNYGHGDIRMERKPGDDQT